LVGRNPTPRAGITTIVPVDDPDRSISKVHLEFGLEEGRLWVKDRGSTNGSTVVRPGGPPQAMTPSERVWLNVGDTVTFGDRRFEVRPETRP
jgi:pSer/pThr/pTyr-binding forkhead associated (FHA) protein